MQVSCTASVWSFVDAIGNSTVGVRILAPFTNSTSTVVETITLLPKNATSEIIVAAPATPKGAEKLPPNIVVPESDLHLRRLWGNPREFHGIDEQDTPARKYLLVLTVGYSDKVNVNATVHKFSDNFDLMLFHYDGRTTEWGEFEWSKQAVHISARKQAKWWYAKRFMHPSIVAPYEYIFVWDQDLGVETFDAEEYIKIVKKHGLEISQPGLDITRGAKNYDINVRRNDSEIHKKTLGPEGRCKTVHERPCSGFVEVMAPVFTREAWICTWHMIQNDLVHGWGLDWNFWRCVDDPEEQIGIVDAQYVAHHVGFTLGSQGNATVEDNRHAVRVRASHEFGMFKFRLHKADTARAAALLAPPGAGSKP
ncbi:hypothetical protein EJB05_09069, partial [Eragrostis curvula]